MSKVIEVTDQTLIDGVKGKRLKVFFQEKPYDFQTHNASMCVGYGPCSDACSLKAIRMV